MKRIHLLLLSLMMSIGTQAADKVIKLSSPNLQRKTQTVMQSFSQRQSTREYADRPLSLADMSDLLWAANGINRAESGKRTAPSALNRQDVDIYAILPEGAYRYDATSHELHLVTEGDHRALVADRQKWAGEAPLSLVLTSDLSRFGELNDVKLGAMDAGIVSQNISIFCSAARLATVPRGSMNAEGLREVLKLKKEQVLLLNHPVGYFK